MKRPLKQTDLPAALLAMAVVFSLGPMANASAAWVVCPQGAWNVREEGEREGAHQWLQCLTHAAKRLQGQLAPLGDERPWIPALDLSDPAPATSPGLHRLPSHLRIACRLTDLPPPRV